MKGEGNFGATPTLVASNYYDPPTASNKVALFSGIRYDP